MGGQKLKMGWLILKQWKLDYIIADQNPKKEISRQLILHLNLNLNLNLPVTNLILSNLPMPTLHPSNKGCLNRFFLTAVYFFVYVIIIINKYVINNK